MTMRKRHWFRLIFAVVVAAALFLLWPILLGFIRGEPFSHGLPASIWAERLRDEDRGVRMYAAQVLGEMGPRAEAFVPRLIEALGNRVPQVRWAAADSLGKVGRHPESAVPALARMLTSLDTGDRVWAATGLGLFGPQAGEAAPALAVLLTDGGIYNRRRAAWALGKIGPPGRAAILPLVVALRDEDAELRREAAHALDLIDPGAGARNVVDLAVKAWSLPAQAQCRQPTAGGLAPYLLELAQWAITADPRTGPRVRIGQGDGSELLPGGRGRAPGGDGITATGPRR